MRKLNITFLSQLVTSRHKFLKSKIIFLTMDVNRVRFKSKYFFSYLRELEA